MISCEREEPGREERGAGAEVELGRAARDLAALARGRAARDVAALVEHGGQLVGRLAMAVLALEDVGDAQAEAGEFVRAAPGTATAPELTAFSGRGLMLAGCAPCSSPPASARGSIR